MDFISRQTVLFSPIVVGAESLEKMKQSFTAIEFYPNYADEYRAKRNTL